MPKDGMHLKITSERLGHSTIALNADTYSHVLPDMQRQALTQVDASVFRTRTELLTIAANALPIDRVFDGQCFISILQLPDQCNDNEYKAEDSDQDMYSHPKMKQPNLRRICQGWIPSPVSQVAFLSQGYQTAVRKAFI